MIASLKGLVQAIGPDHAVIEVGGVGYLVQASSRALSGLEPGAATFLLVETQVREEAITLFGFASAAERDWFRLLTGVQGVGGRLALAILGTLAPDEIARAVTLEDKAMIARAPGVGPRLAARIATELKGKAPAFGGGSVPAADLRALAASSAAVDAVSALENLGFRPAEAARAVAEAERDLGELPTPALIREALKRASR
ncbi:Holliday junction branch migration protein RuvA [Sandaracinobacter sp. RS1-74]|uniref:Holliday junction branch migration protein RuvA n=1 Tax=Sandaracinobacteroides sayramensis TaxID=2913411 RepID=UPI001EDB4C2F|nr:Holliday junction branch migration protein RuvA [Sandaracinobacteroides sayramensis]MCG2840726.1 Holliday junction branch migration protein RuvA [Sandaracinobacteroides sayramensis]